MNKFVLIALIVILIIIIVAYYYLGDVSSKYEFKQGLDIFGYDLAQVNAEFKSLGKNTVKDAMQFALTKPGVVGFVKLVNGDFLFKSFKPPVFTPCTSNLCVAPDTGLYLKR